MKQFYSYHMIISLSLMHSTLVMVFEHIFELCINMVKCGVVGIDMPDNTINNVANTIGCVTLTWPITYLDVSLGGNPRCKSFWEEMVSKVF